MASGEMAGTARRARSRNIRTRRAPASQRRTAEAFSVDVVRDSTNVFRVAGSEGGVPVGLSLTPTDSAFYVVPVGTGPAGYLPTFSEDCVAANRRDHTGELLVAPAGGVIFAVGESLKTCVVTHTWVGSSQ